MWVTGTDQRVNSLRSVHLASGFTLLELMVVLVILGLSLAIMTPNIGSLSERIKLKTSVQETMSLLTYARGLSISAGQLVEVSQFGNGRQLGILGTKRILDPDPSIQVSIHGSDLETLFTLREAIYFFPDGSSSGGAITFEHQMGQRTLTIDWLSGRVMEYEQ